MRYPSLEVELVPTPCWWSNLRSMLTAREWEKCKRITKRQAGAVCEICGGVGPRYPVDCHEVWSYDENTQVQKLERLIALCPACHEVKHIGRAFATGNAPRAVARLANINGWSESDVETYLEVMFEIHALRSRLQWTVDMSWLWTIGIRPPATDRKPDATAAPA